MIRRADSDDVDGPPEFFRKRLVIIRCATWFASRKYDADGAKTIEWYIGTIEANGDVAVFRGIDTDKLDKERAMVAAHNQRVADTGTAWIGPTRATRADTAATRQPPKTDRGMFDHAA